MRPSPPADPGADQLAAARRDREARLRNGRPSMVVMTIAAVLQWMIFFHAVPDWEQKHADGVPFFPHMVGILMAAIALASAINHVPDSSQTPGLHPARRQRHIIALILMVVGGVFGAMALGNVLYPHGSSVCALTSAGYAFGLGLLVYRTDPYPPPFT